jgi:hypothetical protein
VFARATKPRRLSKNAPLFNTAVHQKMTERSRKIKLPFQQKSRSPHQVVARGRVTKPWRLSKNAPLFQYGRSSNDREVTQTQNKDALSEKKPLSAPGFIARVQQSRSDRNKLKALLHACNETWCGSRLFC